MPNTTPPGFKRLNFFTGFFTTAQDWLQGQEYHLEKRKLHLRGLHTPGIIPGEREELKVTAGEGSVVSVAPGAALDRHGNLLYLADTRTSERIAPPGDDKPVYVYLQYNATETDYQVNVDYPEYSGAARISENPRIIVSSTEPEHFDGVVLARVTLEPDGTGIAGVDTEVARRAGVVDGVRDALFEHVRVQLGELDASHLALSERLYERLRKVYEYYLAQQRRHNQGLYRPGLLPDVLEQLAVKPVTGLTVEVRPGAALDGAGNELYLDRAAQLNIPPAATARYVYIIASFEDRFDEYVQDLNVPFELPAGSEPLDRYRTLRLSLAGAAPDASSASIELARVYLATEATEVRLPHDPGQPQENEIDQRALRPALSKAVVEDRLASELRDQIIDLMRSKRREFAKLGAEFPVPAATDVRLAALNLETLARNESLQPGRLTEVWGLFATLEQEVEQQIGDAYPPVVARLEFGQYRDAVKALSDAVRARAPEQVLLNRQRDVVAAAGSLAAVVFRSPDAEAGPDQKVTTLTGEADVTLDASSSQAFADQKIVRYHWDKEE